MRRPRPTKTMRRLLFFLLLVSFLNGCSPMRMALAMTLDARPSRRSLCLFVFPLGAAALVNAEPSRAAEKTLPPDVFDGEWRLARESLGVAFPLGEEKLRLAKAESLAEVRDGDSVVRYENGLPTKNDADIVRQSFAFVKDRVFEATDYAFMSTPVPLARKIATRYTWQTNKPDIIYAKELVYFYLPGPFDTRMFCPLPNNPLPLLALSSRITLRRQTTTK